jgi:hypothetical protein
MAAASIPQSEQNTGFRLASETSGNSIARNGVGAAKVGNGIRGGLVPVRQEDSPSTRSTFRLAPAPPKEWT